MDKISKFIKVAVIDTRILDMFTVAVGDSRVLFNLGRKYLNFSFIIFLGRIQILP